ncbi:tyrosine-type recombinase/integrase [Gordonia aichiensis]|uniref:tyrosine-type recombinase/integrase n=1 Tax=Gordonia aichiensis TaxID=36820 RepID=UPI003264B9D8
MDKPTTTTTTPQSSASVGRQTRAVDIPKPVWFSSYLNVRRQQKHSANTIKALCGDFVDIASVIAAGRPLDDLTVADLTRERLGEAFAVFADSHSANSQLRCWSTWNGLCSWLLDEELMLGVNPMRKIRRPKRPQPKSKAVDRTDLEKILDAVSSVDAPPRSWPELERAIILVGVLVGARASELIAINTDHFRRTPTGLVVTLNGKGDKSRPIPVGEDLEADIDEYLQSRAQLFGHPNLKSPKPLLESHPPGSPLFVGADGERLTRGTLEYRLRRAFRRAGVTPPDGALAHSLRHSFATGLADSGITPYKLRRLMGHTHLSATQVYLEGAGQDTREDIARNAHADLARRHPPTPDQQ